MEIKLKNTNVKLLKDKKRNTTLVVIMPEYYWHKHLEINNIGSYKIKGTDLLLFSYIKRKFNIVKLTKEIKKWSLRWTISIKELYL